MQRVIALAIGLLCTHAEQAQAKTSLTPVSLYSDISYISASHNPKQQLDIYQPNACTSTHPCPMVMFIHGGGWQVGSRQDVQYIAYALAAHYNVVVANVSYRLSSDAVYPAFLHDNAAALSWLHKHARQYGGKKRMHIMGHSAGGYNALMLALNPEWLAPHTLAPEKTIAGVVALAAPYSINITATPYKNVFPPTQVERYQLDYYINANTNIPPLLLINAEGDAIIPPEYNQTFIQALHAVRAPYQQITITEANHFTLPLYIFRNPTIAKFLSEN